jgi:NADPH:quinone reductase-like Zn-dependent oxidoreductase
VPALTADQALRGALGVRPGVSVLVNGAGGVTGTLIVQLATHLGADVIAVAGRHSAARIAAAGAVQVLDRRSSNWPGQIRELTGGRGADLAVNAAPGGAARAIEAVKDHGRLATITSDPPDAERGIQIRQVYVAPDGPGLASCSPPGKSASRPVRHFRWNSRHARSPTSGRAQTARRLYWGLTGA